VACDAIGIEPRGRAPSLGEHTRQVLEQDLGLTSQDIAALSAAGAIR
jgi:crotonobetainyl-CoA:carnitine CoA-transferase CaiB-like acyl-CoA transferase